MHSMNRFRATILTTVILTLVGALACGKPEGELIERKADGFRAVFPGPVAERNEALETEWGESQVRQFIHLRWDEQYELSINELPPAVRETAANASADRTAPFAEVRDRLLRRYRGALEQEREIRSNGVDGLDLTVRTGGGGLVRTRLFEREGRLYIASARVRGNPEAETRARNFVQSFEMTSM